MIPFDAVFIILLMIAKNNDVSAFSQPSPSSSSDWLPNLQQEVTAAQQQQQPPPPLQSQSVSSSFNKQPPPLPNTENSYTLLGLNQDEKDLTIVQRSYRQLAKLYHPDVCVGPDATIEERERANKDFVRINEAYDNIKSRGGEEEIEVVIMGGNFSQGKRGKCAHVMHICIKDMFLRIEQVNYGLLILRFYRIIHIALDSINN